MTTVSVEIAGNMYKIATDDDPEYLRQLANFVTVKILEIRRDTSASYLDCAMMTALEFADRYMKEANKKKPASRKKDLPELGAKEEKTVGAL